MELGGCSPGGVKEIGVEDRKAAVRAALWRHRCCHLGRCDSLGPRRPHYPQVSVLSQGGTLLCDCTPARLHASHDTLNTSPRQSPREAGGVMCFLTPQKHLVSCSLNNSLERKVPKLRMARPLRTALFNADSPTWAATPVRVPYPQSSTAGATTALKWLCRSRP